LPLWACAPVCKKKTSLFCFLKIYSAFSKFLCISLSLLCLWKSFLPLFLYFAFFEFLSIFTLLFYFF
jgi:hypothetical protein